MKTGLLQKPVKWEYRKVTLLKIAYDTVVVKVPAL
jgi:hypothetical protein